MKNDCKVMTWEEFLEEMARQSCPDEPGAIEEPLEEEVLDGKKIQWIRVRLPVEMHAFLYSYAKAKGLQGIAGAVRAIIQEKMEKTRIVT